MTAFFRFHLNSSSRKAMTGWVRATDVVMPAMKRRRNHMPPKIWPSGIFWKMIGRDTKPRSKAPPLAMTWVWARPKKATATGMAIVPPRMTSANSLTEDGRQAVQRDVLFFADIGGVGLDDALAQAQGEEDLAGGDQPDRCRPRRLKSGFHMKPMPLAMFHSGWDGSGVPSVRTRMTRMMPKIKSSGMPYLARSSMPLEMPLLRK